MIEARIECQCNRIGLPDLSLVLVKGQVVYMDAPKAKGSRDLQRAWQASAVSIKYVERFRERREAEIKHPLYQRGSVSMVAAPPEPLEEKVHDILLVDPGEIAARVVQELAKNPVQLEQLQALEDRVVARVTAAIAQALGNLPSRPVAVAAPVAVGRVPVDDVPVFVPSKIGDDALKANLDLEPQRADEGAVSEAAAALRAARKAGKNDGRS